MSKLSGKSVLIVAPNASAKMGGEAFLPLKYFQILKQRGEAVSMIAHSRNRTELSELLHAYTDDIHYIEDSIYHRAAWRVGKILPDAIRVPLIGNIVKPDQRDVPETYDQKVAR